VYYYFSDQIGTSQLIFNATSGAVCYDSDSTPFGYQMVYTTGCAQEYEFAGMEIDSETDNYATWFREYEPNLGRWLSPDPLGGDITNPQTLNRYPYVANNPTTSVDPLGLYLPAGYACYNPMGMCAGNTGWAGSEGGIMDLEGWETETGYDVEGYPYYYDVLVDSYLPVGPFPMGFPGTAVDDSGAPLSVQPPPPCRALNLNNYGTFYDPAFFSADQVSDFFSGLNSFTESFDGAALTNAFAGSGINPGVGVGIINAETSFWNGNPNNPFNSGGTTFQSSLNRGLGTVVKLENNSFSLGAPLSNLTTGENSLGQQYTNTTKTADYNAGVNSGFRRLARSQGQCQ
jgi:RHS repeat-associated protein